MKKLSAKRYVQGFCIIVLVLAILREAVPSVAFTKEERIKAETGKRAEKTAVETRKTSRTENREEREGAEEEPFKAHRIYSVPGYDRCFDDNNDVQLSAAVRYGVRPIADREEAERRKDELVYIGSNPYFAVEDARSSIPYLVPRASALLQDIGKNFFDSLQIKGIPLHKMIVTSVLRTRDDVEKLQRRNANAVPNSCHQYATTFDISYNRYQTVAPPGEERRQVRNDTLKWILSEVLYDMKKRERCYVKHEKKQGCFHITVR